MGSLPAHRYQMKYCSHNRRWLKYRVQQDTPLILHTYGLDFGPRWFRHRQTPSTIPRESRMKDLQSGGSRNQPQHPRQKTWPDNHKRRYLRGYPLLQSLHWRLPGNCLPSVPSVQQNRSPRPEKCALGLDHCWWCHHQIAKNSSIHLPGRQLIHRLRSKIHKSGCQGPHTQYILRNQCLAVDR